MTHTAFQFAIPRVPIGDFFTRLIDFLQRFFGWFFDGIKFLLAYMIEWVESLLKLSFIPSSALGFMSEGLRDFVLAFIIILTFVGLALLVVPTKKRKIILATGTFLGLMLVYSMNLWAATMETLSLVFVSSIMALTIGIPIGIFAARKANANNVVIKPILDFMQTMPAFVYLLPAVALFSGGLSVRMISNVQGAVATIIFSMPPVVRLTTLGIQQVPKEVVEAAKSLGSSGKQLLFKVQLPVALPTIFAGINQTIMLALSMVVIASMVGARGLGYNVRFALARGISEIGSGFEAGLAVVIIAIIIDRLTASLAERAKI